MLRSLLHYQRNMLFAFIGSLASITFSLESSAESPFAHPRVMVMDIANLSSEELMANSEQLRLAQNPLNEAEIGQRLMSHQWLEAGMADSHDYLSGNDALEELAEDALKYYWDALVERDQRYNRYTPVVEGNFNTQSGGADYGVRLSNDTLKLSVNFAF